MFQVGAYDTAANNFTFGYGGFQVSPSVSERV
jgi:hypothetical protein